MTVRSNIKRLAGETVVYGLSPVLLRLLSFLTVPIYTRLLQPADYGVMGLVASITTLVGAILMLGLDGAAAVLFSAAKTHDERRSTMATWLFTYLSVSLLASVSLYAASSHFHRWFFSGYPETRQLFLIVSVAMFVTGLSNVASLTLRLERRKWWVVGLALAQGGASTAFGLFFVGFLHTGVKGIYLAQVAAGVPFFIVNIWLMRPWLNLASFSAPRLSELLKIGLPTMPAHFGTWIVGMADRLIVQHYHGLSDVGLMSIAQSLAMSLGFLCSGFQQAWAPFSLSLQNEATADDTYSKVLTIFLLITCLPALALSLFAREILALLTPKSYHDAGLLVAYYAFATIGTGVYFTVSIGINLSRRTHHLGWTATAAAALNISLNLIVVPIYGPMGAAVSTLAAQWTAAALLYVMAQRCYPIPYRLDHAAIVLCASWITLIVGRQCDHFGYGWGSVLKLLSMGLFVGAIFVFRVVRASEVGDSVDWLKRRLGFQNTDPALA